jgi:hypothetical protein
MAICGVGYAAFDIGHCRERRVHQHDAGRDGGIEMIVDLGRVEAGDGNGREEKRQQAGAGVGQLVEDERAAGDLGEDGEQAGAGRRLQHPVGRVIAAAWAATRPSGIGVENCWKVWLSAERRVCVGRRLAIFDSAERRAAGDPALRKSARPYLRRNRTVAASQAS